MDSFTKLDQAQRGDTFHRHQRKPCLRRFQLRAFGVHTGFKRFMKFFFQPTSRVHLHNFAGLLEVCDFEVGQQNPLKRFDAWRRLWLPDANRQTCDGLPHLWTVSGDLRGAQDQVCDADFQACLSRCLTGAGAQIQLQLAATGSGSHGLKQFSCSLTTFCQQDTVLIGTNDKAMSLFFTFAEMIKNVSTTVADFDPDNVLAIGCWSNAARRLLPQSRFQLLSWENSSRSTELLHPWLTHVILLISQTQNFHARAARRSLIGLRRPAHSQGRMEVKADLRILARSHGPKSDDLSGLGTMHFAGIFNDQVATRLFHLIQDSLAMTGLQIIGCCFRVTEKCIGSFQVIRMRKYLRQTFTGT